LLGAQPRGALVVRGATWPHRLAEAATDPQGRGVSLPQAG